MRRTASRATPLTELEADYVDTFDNRRRHNLFLTYFAHGDTRKRGMALLRFKQTYLRVGLRARPTTELPDHLCVVLEYAATIDQRAGPAADPRPPGRARAAADLARRGGLRWAGAVEAVTATLPPLRGDEMEAVRRLAAEGPPEEEVGLTPYATPAFDPDRLARRPDPLPMPSFPGAPLMDVFLWVIVPYLCLTTFVVGHFWRYRYDKFGWTTRSSQLYEDRMLRIGSPLFHFGMLGVVGGHVIGLLVPESWTDAVGRQRPRPTTSSRSRGGLLGRRDGRGRHGDPDLPPPHGRAGVLGDHGHGQGDVRVPRRRDRARACGTPSPARSSPSAASTTTARECRSGTARSSPSSPHAALMAEAPLGFQLHALVAFGLFALWPFTRLVHVFSAPVGYLTRPYIVYRSRDDQLGCHRPRRGWDRVG